MQTSIDVKWISHLGVTWDLMRGTEGVTLTSGLESLMLPSFTPKTTRTARAPGRRFHGIDLEEFSAQLGVTVADTWVSRPDGSFRRGAQWLGLDAAFRESFSPTEPGTLQITSPSGTRRYIGRLEDLEAESMSPMPDVRGRQSYDISLGADMPLYFGDVVAQDFPFVESTAENYYGPNNLAPPFYISAGNAAGNAQVLNPGQVETWPTWIIDGPGQAIVGVGDHMTHVPALGAGQRLVIVTDPHRTSVTDEGGNRAWDRMELYDFAPIPVGDQVPISVHIIGGGPGANIRLELVPLYLGPY